MDNMWPMFYETIFGIFALYILTRVLGKTQISQLTAFDFIAAIVLGELVGNALFDKKTGLLDIGFVILLWGIILYIIEIVTQKFKGSRFLLEGKPAILIHEGNLVYEELRKNKIDLNEVLHLLRMKDIFSLQEVYYAILETNGELSVLKKAEYESPTKQDLQLPLQQTFVATPVIMDGEIIYDNLKEIDMTEKQLRQSLEAQHQIGKIKDVFYAEFVPGQPLFLLPYHKIKHKDYMKKSVKE
ncbi:DUF421 domain-containing protein [Pseudogracilibacillus sp. ICA-222130]|uniref:DUF421 domain-containing protein n=1 Tax=Pseudogracilibacillus sp. ICA-222130 TaxID=3134655 RepID=UPI0030BD15E9